jgi:TRAP-type uncharacterized transport system substrate-binding protein
LSDGLIDVAVIYSAIPSSAINSLVVQKKIRLVKANEKILRAVAKQEMMLCYFVRPGTYKGQDEGAFAWAQPATTFYNETADTMDVYKWTKTIIEHKDILQKVHPLGKEVRLLNKDEHAHCCQAHCGITRKRNVCSDSKPSKMPIEVEHSHDHAAHDG